MWEGAHEAGNGRRRALPISLGTRQAHLPGHVGRIGASETYALSANGKQIVRGYG